MINFAGGLIRTPDHKNKNLGIDAYINPDKVVNFIDSDGTTIIALNNGTTCELENISAESFANAFIRANNSGGIVDILA